MLTFIALLPIKLENYGYFRNLWKIYIRFNNVIKKKWYLGGETQDLGHARQVFCHSSIHPTLDILRQGPATYIETYYVIRPDLCITHDPPASAFRVYATISGQFN